MLAICGAIGLLLLDRLLPPTRLPCEHGWSGTAVAIYIQDKGITTKGHYKLRNPATHFLVAAGGFITYCIILVFVYGIFLKDLYAFDLQLNFVDIQPNYVGILLNSVDYKPLDFEMQQPPTSSGVDARKPGLPAQRVL